MKHRRSLIIILLALFLAPGFVQAANERLKRDALGNPVVGGVSDDAAQTIIQIRVNPATKALMVEDTSGGGGTVDQGISGVSDADPWNMMIRNGSGLELGLAASPFAVRLFDGAAAALGTAANRIIVDVFGSLPAGTNNIGDFDLASAIPAGTNEIGLIGLVDAGGDRAVISGSGAVAVANTAGAELASESGQASVLGQLTGINNRGGTAGDGNNTEGTRPVSFLTFLSELQPLPTGGFDYNLGEAGESPGTLGNPTARPHIWSMNADGGGKVRLFDESATSVGTGGNPLRFDPTGSTTQPISASSLPLPTGAATEATLGTIDADTSSLAGTVAGSEQQVDIVAPLPAGTNNIGDVDLASSIPAGTNNIGDVDLASSIPAGTNNIGDVDVLTLPAAPANDGVDIGDVTVNNAAGASALNIQDGGNTISVDGTITANVGTTGGLALESTLTTIDTDTSALAGTVSGSEQQVDVVTSALPSGASTSSNQTTGNTSLDQIDAGITIIGNNTAPATIFAHGAVSVGTTITLISAADPKRRSLLIRNADSGTIVFLGGASVTTANGLPVGDSGAPGATGDGGTVIYTHTQAVHGVTSSGTADIRFQTESD